MDRNDSGAVKSVTQDNALVNASYTMSLHEKRLLVAAIAQLDPTSKAWLNGRAEVTVLASEWAELFGLDQKSAYKRLRKASADLYSRSVRIKGDHRNGRNIRWLQAEEYSADEGRVTIVFSGEVLHYLTSLFDEFTKYDLLGVAGLKSTHSVRLYELSSQFKDTGWRYIPLDELREMFCLKDAYPRWQDLKKFVVDRACKEITAKSDLEVSYEIVKRGRSVHAIRLKIEDKEQLELFT